MEKMILTDVFKPDCDKKICCLYCSKQDKCKNACTYHESPLYEMDCDNCFYVSQGDEDVKTILGDIKNVFDNLEESFNNLEEIKQNE